MDYKVATPSVNIIWFVRIYWTHYLRYTTFLISIPKEDYLHYEEDKQQRWMPGSSPVGLYGIGFFY